LARLGWSRGDKEVFYLDDLIRDFEITEVQKAGAIFDTTKLDFLNVQHMANLSIEEFMKYLEPFMQAINIDLYTHNKYEILIDAMRSSGNTFKEVAQNLTCYYERPGSYNQKAIEKFIGGSTVILNDLKDCIINIDDWTEDSIDKMLSSYRNLKDLSVPKVNQPLRIALTGSTNSPSLGLTLSLFEKPEVLERINKLIGFIETSN
jgi:glutamyl-tRNA synthetase